ncbi:DUF6200 domain-containing protein [Geminicoccus flavidas]|uniref:DUF6200 domain-containing protein n=1 Tax=Geminicoccus flavidas TaxID=2506407 RepID=UPI001358B04F|nr:hypothetical protein [Geminicoccus flavidas]
MAETTVIEKKQVEPPPEPTSETVIIDMGEHSRRRVRQLRRGEGRLMEKVEDALADLEEQGVIQASAQRVVIVVRQEPSLGGLFDGDDDDDDDDD